MGSEGNILISTNLLSERGRDRGQEDRFTPEAMTCD